MPIARALPMPAGLDSGSVAVTVFKGLTAEYLTHLCVALRPSDTVLLHAAGASDCWPANG